MIAIGNYFDISRVYAGDEHLSNGTPKIAIFQRVTLRKTMVNTMYYYQELTHGKNTRQI